MINGQWSMVNDRIRNAVWVMARYRQLTIDNWRLNIDHFSGDFP